MNIVLTDQENDNQTRTRNNFWTVFPNYHVHQYTENHP